jgi:uncharacterized protein YdhG (YjbR/CyaY superfamily)
MTKPLTIDDYIAQFSGEVHRSLTMLRTTIAGAAPEAVEKISYGMPAYTLLGRPLVYFAAHKHHIGFYATPTGHEAFKIQLAAYKQGKGSVQFPLDQPMPTALIARIVRFRVKENHQKLNNK